MTAERKPRGSRTQRKLASVLIGLIVAVAGGELGWLVVKTWLLVSFESGAYTAAPEMALVVAAAVIPAVAATVFCWRALVGEPVVRTSWTLELEPRAAGTRPAEEPCVRDLVTRLDADGFRVACWLTDEAAHRAGPAAPETSLRGIFLELVESGGDEGRIVVRLPVVDDFADARGKPALGFVDVHGAVGGRYEALGAAVMAALRDLLPEIRKL